MLFLLQPNYKDGDTKCPNSVGGEADESPEQGKVSNVCQSCLIVQKKRAKIVIELAIPVPKLLFPTVLHQLLYFCTVYL